MKTISNPLFTVVTVTFNAERTIAHTIESIINQRFLSKEIIVVDGKSKDKTIQIINKYRDKISTFISEKDDGIFDAMNKGIKYAKGKYIIFINSGDSFYDENVLSEIKTDDFDVIYGNNAIKVRGKLKIIKPSPFWESQKIVKTMGICHQSIFIKTSYAREHLFDTSYKLTADYNMIYNARKEGKTFKYIDLPIDIYDIYGISSRNLSLKYKEISEITSMKDSLKFKLMTFIYIAKEISKNRIKRIFKIR